MVAYPTDSSLRTPCSFCHDPTLQQHRLLSVTTNVTVNEFEEGVFVCTNDPKVLGSRSLFTGHAHNPKGVGTTKGGMVPGRRRKSRSGTPLLFLVEPGRVERKER